MKQLLARADRRALGLGATAAILALVLTGALAAAPPTDAPCPGVRPSDLAFDVRADPSEVSVGDLVEVEAQITSSGDGHAAIPLFRLFGTEPGFTVEAQESSYPALTYARYRLRAVQSGDVGLRIVVNFATTTGCGDSPSLVFRTASSQVVPIRVRDVAVGGPLMATPTGTAIPAITPRPARQRPGRR